MVKSGTQPSKLLPSPCCRPPFELGSSPTSPNNFSRRCPGQCPCLGVSASRALRCPDLPLGVEHLLEELLPCDSRHVPRNWGCMTTAFCSGRMPPMSRGCWIPSAILCPEALDRAIRCMGDPSNADPCGRAPPSSTSRISRPCPSRLCPCSLEKSSPWPCHSTTLHREVEAKSRGALANQASVLRDISCWSVAAKEDEERFNGPCIVLPST